MLPVFVPEEKGVEYRIHFLPVNVLFAVTPWDVSCKELVVPVTTNSLLARSVCPNMMCLPFALDEVCAVPAFQKDQPPDDVASSVFCEFGIAIGVGRGGRLSFVEHVKDVTEEGATDGDYLAAVTEEPQNLF
jgi:hypothetical protein